MARHGLRGMVSAWLGLIALQAVAAGGSGKVAGFFGEVDRLVNRALDPSVPAIPDRRDGRTLPSVAGAAAVGAGARVTAGSWPTYNVPAPSARPASIPPLPR